MAGSNMISRNMQTQRQSTSALAVPRTVRRHRNPILMRMDPGLVVPIAAFGMHREDAVMSGTLAVAIQMDETAEVLLNPVQVKVTAYLVPWLAFERFSGRDEFEASYSKVPAKEGEAVIPFIETHPRGEEGIWPINDALGLHGKPTQQVSTMYVEAYNKIINYRNLNVSMDLPERTRLQASLAAAIRDTGRHRNIVPSFDAAAMEGVVDIDLVGGAGVAIDGIGTSAAAPIKTGASAITETGGDIVPYPHYLEAGKNGVVNGIFFKSNSAGVPQITVDMDGAEMAFSLASIERAKKMQVFANIRKRYAGLDDDALIQKLMDGINIPDKMFEQPIELGSKVAGFGFSKRYATDSANLDQSVVQGATMLSMQFATPRINTGGVVMFVAEIQPEMLFERQADPFFTVLDVSSYPQFIRDDGDEQKVEMIRNWQIDTAHTDPQGLFGYTPLNSRWNIDGPRIGTGFFQPSPQIVFDEDRARIWDTTPVDPSLGADWYLCSPVDKGVFEYSDRQPFEVSGLLDVAIGGNTVFGRELIEGGDDYEKISAIIPGPDDQINP